MCYFCVLWICCSQYNKYLNAMEKQYVTPSIELLEVDVE